MDGQPVVPALVCVTAGLLQTLEEVEALALEEVQC